jgi:oligopeptide transport system ATP-binding protein
VNPEPLLAVEHLTTVFDTASGAVAAVNDISFEIRAGETLGLVGESGSGKSVTALSLMRLVLPPGRIAAGRLLFKGRDLLTLDEREMQRVRGAGIGLIFQEPMTALNPVFRVGAQIAETLIVHGRATRRDATGKAIALLRAVRIADPEARIADYPHQLSGGMRQRVLIALALACQPSLVIADEPTTALDVTIQAQILDLMKALQVKSGTGVIMITHSMGVVAGVADRVQVMYAGHIVETATTEEIFANPRHPYTVGLMKSIPRLDARTKERLEPIRGLPPDLIDLPDMCPFVPRCNYAREQCEQKNPPLLEIAPGHYSACWFWEEVSKDGEPPRRQE